MKIAQPRKIMGLLAVTALVASNVALADITVSAAAPDAASTIHSSLATGGIGSKIDSEVASNAGRGQLLNIGEAAGAYYQFEITAFTVRSAAAAFTGAETFTVTAFLGTVADWTAGTATKADPLAGSTCTLLKSETFAAPAPVVNNEYMTFTFDEAITVDENADIGIMITMTDNGGINDWFYKEGAETGRIQLKDGTPNGGTSSRNMNISFQGTAVPEPATLGLVAVFGGAALFIRRRTMK